MQTTIAFGSSSVMSIYFFIMITASNIAVAVGCILFARTLHTKHIECMGITSVHFVFLSKMHSPPNTLPSLQI